MRAMSTATRRQARVFGAFRQSRQRTQPEEQNQKNGEATTHLQFMLAGIESISMANSKKVTIAISSLGGKNETDHGRR
jgi:hypothetical protein